LQYRILDKNGDYTLGQNSMKQDKEAVAQAIQTRLGLLYRQWWENTEDGLPLFEKILGAYGDNKEMIDILISERIAQTKDVKEIKIIFLILIGLILVGISGFSSYAIFTSEITSPNEIKGIVTQKTTGAETLIAKVGTGGLVAESHPETSQLQATTDYRYTGKNPDNYIKFNNETWRIIGVFNVDDVT